MDISTSLSDFLKRAEPEQRKSDPMPDSVKFVRDNLQSIFSKSSKPRGIMAAPARPNGYGWKVCIKGLFSDLAGNQAVPMTFVLLIDGGKVGDRRKATNPGECDSETYSAI